MFSSESQLQSYFSNFAQSSLEKEVHRAWLSPPVGYNIQLFHSHWEEVTKFVDDTKPVRIVS